MTSVGEISRQYRFGEAIRYMVVAEGGFLYWHRDGRVDFRRLAPDGSIEKFIPSQLLKEYIKLHRDDMTIYIEFKRAREKKIAERSDSLKLIPPLIGSSRRRTP